MMETDCLCNVVFLNKWFRRIKFFNAAFIIKLKFGRNRNTYDYYEYD